MNWYQKHLGDYARDTRHLSMTEHGAYNILLDHYYATEKPIPGHHANAIAGARKQFERVAVRRVLNEFFSLSDDGMWHHKKVVSVIAEAKHKSLTAQESALIRWGKKAAKDDANALPSQSDRNASQQPEANNHKEATSTSPVARKRATEDGERLAENWIPDAALSAWAISVRPGIQLQREVEAFRDYWTALPGVRAKKLDWGKTFRNHIRRGLSNGNAPRLSAADRVAANVMRARAERAAAGIRD